MRNLQFFFFFFYFRDAQMEVLPLSLSKEQPLVYNIDSYMWDCGDLNKFASGGELWPVSNARSKASYN